MNISLVFVGLIASVILGGMVVTYLNATNKSQFIKLALAFSGGFLLAIIFQHLIPDIYADGQAKMGIFILIGFLVQLILEYFSGELNTDTFTYIRDNHCRGYCLFHYRYTPSLKEFHWEMSIWELSIHMNTLMDHFFGELSFIKFRWL